MKDFPRVAGARRALLVGVFLLAGGACAGEAAPGAAGSKAPEFRATTLTGDTVTLATFAGRPILVNLWATWCAPCRRETPFLQSVHERYAPRGLEVVGVSMDTRSALRDVEAFMQEFGVTYRVLHDPDGRSMDQFAAIGLPATYLIDGEGTILWSRLGEVREDDRSFHDALEAAIAEAGAAGTSPAEGAGES